MVRGVKAMKKKRISTEYQDHDAIQQELLARFEYAKEYREHFEAEYLKGYNDYLGQRKLVKNGRSQLFIQKTFEILDTWRARLVKSAFGSVRPYIDTIPKVERFHSLAELQTATEKSNIAGTLLDEQFEKNNIISVYWDYATNLMYAPAACMAVSWKKEMRKVRKRVRASIDVPGINMFGMQLTQNFSMTLPFGWVESEVSETVWDDNYLQAIDFLDAWPDPRGKNQCPDSWRFAFTRDFLTQEEIEDHLRTLQELIDMNAISGRIFEIKWDEIPQNADETESRNMRLASIGKETPADDGFYFQSYANEARDKISKKNRIYEVLHYWTGDEYGLIINRYKIGYIGDTPFQRHRQIPLIYRSFEPVPGEVIGRSACHFLHDHQEELNTHRNQVIDNVSMILNAMWLVPDSFDREYELISKPGGIIHYPAIGGNAEQVIRRLEVGDVASSAYSNDQLLKQEMENILGTPPVVTGGNSNQGDMTATEVVTQNGNASIRFDIRILLHSIDLKRLAMMMDKNNQQFITETRLVKQYDVEGIDAWIEVDPEDILGEYDYRYAGANVDPAANKEIRRQQFLQAIQAVKGMGMESEYSVSRMFSDYLNTFDFRNTEKYKLTDEEKLQQQMQMNQVLGGMLNGGAEPGATSDGSPSGNSQTEGQPGFSGAG
jgi:hypothetical protein